MGCAPARKRGRVGGNPKLLAGDKDAIQRITEARNQSYFDRINRTAEHWLPIVRQMRPDHRWEDVVRVLNAGAKAPSPARWSVERLKRSYAGKWVMTA